MSGKEEKCYRSGLKIIYSKVEKKIADCRKHDAPVASFVVDSKVSNSRDCFIPH